jgi:hypothetical protein
MAVLHGHAGRFRRFWPRAVAVVKILVAAGVNVNSRGMQGVTPLYSAITYKHLDIARCRLGAPSVHARERAMESVGGSGCTARCHSVRVGAAPQVPHRAAEDQARPPHAAGLALHP